MEILKYPDPRLRRVAEPVELSEIDDDLRQTIGEMFQTMRKAGGVGLAAPQVGINKRIFVCHFPEAGLEWYYRTFINPFFLRTSGCMYGIEGCLSIPGVEHEIRRYSSVSVMALDEYGKCHTAHGIGIISRCLQHEIDHLDGRLFIDQVEEYQDDG